MDKETINEYEKSLLKKLPLWKDIKIDDSIKTISDEELASRVKKIHNECIFTMKKIQKFINENK